MLVTPEARIVTFQGNELLYPVKVKTYGTQVGADLSTASQIQIDWENEEGESQPIITVADTLAGADWTVGDVVLPIGASNFTAEIGTYTFALTILIGGQVVTVLKGTVDVQERPGFPAP